MGNNKKITDEEYNNKWRSMLKVFHDINPKSPSATKEYLELQQESMNTIYLTSKQKEGIYGRCQNSIDGTYGNTKTQANLNFGTPPVTKEQANGKP